MRDGCGALSDAKPIHELTLAQLDAASAEAVAARFAEVRARFDAETGRIAAGDSAGWTALRNAWLGRTSGVLSGIADNRLRQTPHVHTDGGAGEGPVAPA